MNASEALQHRATSNGHKSPTQIANEAHGTKLTQWDAELNAALAGPDGEPITDPIAKHDALWGLLLKKAGEVINSDRNISQQKSAIKALAASLNFKPDNQFVSSLFAQLDSTAAAYEPDIAPGDVFTAPTQSWLLHEIFLIGLNLLVGMPGAGKSRLLVAMIRAYLADQPTFINRALEPGSNQKVLLIGTDQDRQQWGALLAEQGLATEIGRDDAGKSVSYRLHSSIYLKTSGGCFQLDPDGLRWIRNWCRDNPGGLLIIDSLSAVLPAGIKEADENAGRLIRQIEVARQTCTCIVTHHSNKQAAINGELGVYSGSGHGSIDRAVSRFIGLGYETHKENGIDKLHEDSPRRILTSQKRGAGNQRLVLENGHRNSWDYIGTAAEIRELQREDQEGSADESLKGWKKDVYAATTSEWRNTSQVFDSLTPERKKHKNAKQQVRESLRKLDTDHHLIEQRNATIDDPGNEAFWRRRPGGLL
jgi:hypothetical protein